MPRTPRQRTRLRRLDGWSGSDLGDAVMDIYVI
jgi:hypothetical protein